jgi:hypothetical protein
MYDVTRPLEAPEATALRPARFKITSGRFLKETTCLAIRGEIGTTIDVTLSPDARREGSDELVGVLCQGNLIGWISADGDLTRSQLCAIRGHGFEVITTAVFEDFQGALSLCVQVPKTPALASWLEWRRPGF